MDVLEDPWQDWEWNLGCQRIYTGLEPAEDCKTYQSGANNLSGKNQSVPESE
jgi:hypothetical protein